MSTILVTGGSGFLGANVVRKLNDRGIRNIIIVDDYDEQKFKNLKSLSFIDYINFKQGTEKLAALLRAHELSAILHIGANADVLVRDADTMLEANYEHSRMYLELATEKNIPLIYASSSAVYGNNSDKGRPNEENPHNIYAWSKWLFDKYVSANMASFNNRVIGLRLFNIFGMGEFHKGKNASLPYRFFTFVRDNGFIDLFDRHIERDYVWVEDVADVFISMLDDKAVKNGIYDLGGDNPLSHRYCAETVVQAFVDRKIHRPSDDLIATVEMPDELVNSFQFYTKANELLPQIAERVKGNDVKMKKYINQLLDQHYGNG